MKKISVFLCLCILLSMISGCSGDSSPYSLPALSEEAQSTPVDDGRSYTNVASGLNGRLVAVGSDGKLETSADGITWKPVSAPLNVNLRGVACGGGSTWVAAGDQSALVYSDDDGITWNKAESPVPLVGFRAIAWGNGAFIAGGTGGVMLRSTDGHTWDSVQSGTQSAIWGGTFARGQFVMCGQYGTILTSTDGIRWTPQVSGTSDFLWQVGYGDQEGGRFVAVGDRGVAITSPDSVSWTPSASASSQTQRGVVYGRGMFVAAGSGGSLMALQAGSSTWQALDSPTTQTLRGIAFNGSLFTAVGDSGTIVTSYDGVTWTISLTGAPGELWGVAGGNGRLLACGAGGLVLSSADGITWSPLAPPSTDVDLYGIACSRDRFVLVGSLGRIYTWSETEGFVLRTSGTTNNLFCVTWANGLFVAGGLEGTLLTSPDGITWTAPSSPAWHVVRAIAYGNGKWVAAGAGTVAVSSDAVNWTLESIGLLHFQTGASFGNGIFVLPGHAGRVLSSPDGITWQAASAPSPENLDCAAFGNGLFAMGSFGLIETTTDGATFGSVTPPTSRSLRAITFFEGQFVATGGAETILTSPDGKTWTLRHEVNL
ncbi:MAG: hypothetical protein RDV48_05735 [Candidatus Eremiobacteraeota bacterium]|nr:hypothetical protein [Candidatus Eremiobacteraeota bacterium]